MSKDGVGVLDGAGTRGRAAKPGTGELIFDIAILVGSSAYVYVAWGYPSAGRQVPMVVGGAAVIVSLFQLIGYFVPGLRTLTHGKLDPKESTPAPSSQPSEETANDDSVAQSREARDTAIIMAWSLGFLGAILALGYVIAVPLFFLAYFGWQRSWRLAVISAIVMWAFTQYGLVELLSVQLPGGYLL
jgi:hypothetical protein